jgi:hypothetical protein
MKLILIVTLALILDCGYILAESGESTAESETISLGSFEIAMPEGWKYETTTQPNEQVITRIFHPDKDSVFQISSINNLPEAPTQSRMRLLTNVDSSVELNWHKWGNFSGYQYEYTESGKYYRQWWLTHHNKILFVVYSSKTNDKSSRSAIDEMVKSLAIKI